MNGDSKPPLGESLEDSSTDEPDETRDFARSVESDRDADRTRELPSNAPHRIGDYRILGVIGEGGMGIVYEAEQAHPQRPVALKVIRGGAFVTDTQVRMFQREAQTLARLRHPNIAAIYESGAIDGRHFFSMELVRGEPLNEFLDGRAGDQSLTPAELRFRLALFRRICDAVNYAHQRGVIHRDLKPSNIMVLPTSSSGVTSDSFTQEVKILDFGLARITDADPAVPTLVTQLGSIVGTLPYMSPEQVRGSSDEVDTRTDVYSLGVILYELLSGKRPYDLTGADVPEAASIICEQPPVPLARQWGGARRLDPDLETIVMKALDKEPNRRYQSASSLSEDIERYLMGQPIQARSPSAVYQLRKMIARHRIGFGFSLVLVLMLAGFAVVMSVQAGRIARERDRANQQAETSEQVSEFLVSLFRVPDPAQSKGETVTAREILDQGATAIDYELRDKPAIRTRLMDVMSRSYTNLGIVDRGLELAERSRRIRLETGGDNTPGLVDSLLLLSLIEDFEGDYEAAERNAREALDLLRQSSPHSEKESTALQQLGVSLKKLGRLDEAEGLYRESLAIRREIAGKDDEEAVSTITSLAELLRVQGRLDEAEALHREALAAARRIHGSTHPLVGSCLNNLGLVLQDREEFKAAERVLREALEHDRRLYRGDHPGLANRMNNLAALLKTMERYDEAETMHRQALAIRRESFGENHPEVAGSLNNLSVLLMARGEYDEAERLQREALAIVRTLLGSDHPHVGISLYNLGKLLQKKRDWVGAEIAFSEALPIVDRSLPEGNWRKGELRSLIGACMTETGRFGEAEERLREGYEMVVADRGPEDPRSRVAAERLVELYERSGRPQQAAQFRHPEPDGG
jgi:serine/threonine protein kinase/Flp pilus assembly protein TadD